MDRMRQGWPRYVAEGAVIVAGILVALAADAAWGYRVDRADELTALIQLEAEFAANAAQLDSVAAGHRQGLEAVTTLLGAVRGSIGLEPDSIRALIRLIDMTWTFNPKYAALESVIAAGQLGLIRDDLLRVELVGWPGIVDDLTEEELWAAEFAHSAQYELLSTSLNWGDIYGPEEARTDRPMTIVGNEGLESVLAYRHSWFLDAILPDLAKVESATQRVRTLLSENLTTG